MEITLLLFERAASDIDVGYVAAGPLEDLIDLHGHKALDLIEEECKSNPRLRLALSEVGVLFYYDEFDRWYSLLCEYGFRQDSTIESRVVIPKVMHLMNCFLNKAIGLADYDFGMDELLDRPLDDKEAQRVVQGACYDLARLNDTTPPEHRTPQMLQDSELKALVKQLVDELESLGYRANGGLTPGQISETVCYHSLAAVSSGSSSAVERQLPKLDVAGSIPVSRSNVLKKLRDSGDAAPPHIHKNLHKS